MEDPLLLELLLLGRLKELLLLEVLLLGRLKELLLLEVLLLGRLKELLEPDELPGRLMELPDLLMVVLRFTGALGCE